MKFMTVRVRFTEFVKDSEDLENSNLFVFVHIKFEMFEFVWEGKIWRMTPLATTHCKPRSKRSTCEQQRYPLI